MCATAASFLAALNVLCKSGMALSNHYPHEDSLPQTHNIESA